MFERFDSDAKKALHLAYLEAKRLDATALAPEHILLGMLRMEESAALLALDMLNVDRDNLLKRLEKRVPAGELPTDLDSFPATPECKRALMIALTEAQTREHTYFGTEHLIVGILQLESGAAAETLAGAGVELEPMRKALFGGQ